LRMWEDIIKMDDRKGDSIDLNQDMVPLQAFVNTVMSRRVA